MAKGKTNQPITIAVPQGWEFRPEITALADQGHHVLALTDIESVDLILAPQAHFFNDQMLDYLEDAVKAARKRKRETKK